MKLITLVRQQLTPHAIRQLLRYGATGMSAVVADYGGFALLYGLLKVPLLVATVTSLLAGFVVSFVLNRIWVFGASKQKAHKKPQLQIALYTLLFVFNTAFTYLFIFYANQRFGVSAYISKLCTICLVMAWNFVAYKKVIFKVAPNEDFQPM